MIDVPPMTAAATDGRTDSSTSWTSRFARPATRKPGKRRQQRRDDVQRDEHLPDADAGQARGDRVVADGEQQPAVAAPAEADEDQRRQRARTDSRLFGRNANVVPEPSQSMASGSRRRDWTIAAGRRP